MSPLADYPCPLCGGDVVDGYCLRCKTDVVPLSDFWWDEQDFNDPT